MASFVHFCENTDSGDLDDINTCYAERLKRFCPSHSKLE